MASDRALLQDDEPRLEIVSPSTGELVPFTRHGPVIPGVEVTNVSLRLPEGLPIEQWLEIGAILAEFERRNMWFIGDWWAFGDHQYGDRTYHVNSAEWQGPAWGTCANAAAVCRKFAETSRRVKLSFEKHKAVAGIKDDAMALSVLDRAERYGLSVQQLKAEVRAYKRRHLLEDQRVAHSEGSAKFVKIDEEIFNQRFKQASIDLLITDPPYMTDVDDISSFSEWVHRWLPTIKPTGRAYIFTGAYPEELLAYLKRLCPPPTGWTLDNPLIWTYRNTLGPAPTHDYKLNWQACFHLYGPKAAQLNCPWMKEQFSVQDIVAPDGRLGDRYHSWQKPDELAERLIAHSTTDQQLVVDPFCGTGTFVLAAKRLGRRGIGADIDEAALEICDQRLEADNAQ